MTGKGEVDCDAIRDLLPAYSIGAADADEARLVEAGLAACPDLAADLAAYRAVSADLAQAVPQVSAPPEVLAHLMDAARQSRARRAPAAPRRAGRWYALLAACIALVVALNGLLQATRLPQPQQERNPIRMLELPPAQDGDSLARAYVAWTPDGQQAMIVAALFPPLEPEFVYQAWVRRGEDVTSLGTFRVDEGGWGSLSFDASVLEGTFDGVGITAEPVPGSPAPTGPAVVRWRRE